MSSLCKELRYFVIDHFGRKNIDKMKEIALLLSCCPIDPEDLLLLKHPSVPSVPVIEVKDAEVSGRVKILCERLENLSSEVSNFKIMQKSFGNFGKSTICPNEYKAEWFFYVLSFLERQILSGYCNT